MSSSMNPHIPPTLIKLMLGCFFMIKQGQKLTCLRLIALPPFFILGYFNTSLNMLTRTCAPCFQTLTMTLRGVILSSCELKDWNVASCTLPRFERCRGGLETGEGGGGIITVVLRTLNMCQRSTRSLSGMWSGETEDVSKTQVACRLRDAQFNVVQR